MIKAKHTKAVLTTALSAALVMSNASALYAGVNTATTNLNFRDSAGGSVIGAIPSGARVAVIDNTNEWYHVAYNGAIGYVSADYIQQADDGDIDLGTGIVKEDSVNIRTEPSTDAEVMLQLNTDDCVDVNGVVDGWYRIAIDDTAGYIYADYLTFEQQMTDTPEQHHQQAATPEQASEEADTLLAYAEQFLGTPYVYGGSTPSGFDCSGFTTYVFRNALGISLPRTSSEQSQTYTRIDSITDLNPGDLVFFGNGSRVNHVGIYVGQGEFIHSPHTGSYVKFDTLNSGNYNKNFMWGGRVL
nr:SH3 domain-containing C40 family peptidase [uncultured Butyricicoccus sp.]